MHHLYKLVFLVLITTTFLTTNAISSITPFTDQDTLDNKVLFKIKGSNTIGAHLAPNLVKQYMEAKGATDVKIRPASIENEQYVEGIFQDNVLRVHVAAHGSGTGYKGLVSGDADIAASSRPAKSKEAKMFSSLDLYDPSYEHVLAIDGLAVIIHPDIQIESLAIPQIGKLFSGEINNWSQIGGPNLKVSIHARDNKSGTYDTFKSLVLKRGFKLHESAMRYESNDVLSKTVSSTPGAIGFTALANINNAKPIFVSDEGAEALFPTKLSVATEDYPLARRLFFYTTENTNKFAKEFIEFALSTSGQSTVETVGFVSQDIVALGGANESDMPDGYQYMTESSERLSVNFRFKADSYKLDNKALADIRRLKSFMDLPNNQQKKLILVGFSGESNNELRSNVISELRVMKVKKALKEVGIIAHAATGYGDLKPVASNQNAKVSAKNHRVEVWLK